MSDIKFYYDLHIHSVLSPDGDELMTPNNILNMAMLKNLDFVAITDHNSTKQLRTVEQIENAYDFIFIPGIEVTVKEGFDVLCYFPSYEAAHEFDAVVETHLNQDDWGPFSAADQVLTDVYDVELETFPKSLRSTSLPYDELYHQVHERGGIAILAHVERASKSAMNHHRLEDLSFDGIEIQAYRKTEFLNEHPELREYKILTNSDSHSLLTILEREQSLDLSEKSIDAFFAHFQRE